MESIVRYALLSLGTGAIYALVAQGVVLIYRGSGILNFAQGALMMLGAYIYNDLHSHPTPGVDKPWTMGPYGWSAVPSFVAAVVLTGLVGLAFYFFVIRRLRNAAPLAKLIATLGLMIVIQAVVVLRWGPESTPNTSLVSSRPIEIFGTSVNYDRLFLLGMAVVATAVFWAYFKFTTIGLATSAVAENQLAASTLAWSPDRIAGANWFFGSLLGGAFGIVLAPTQGPLGPTQIMLLIVPGVACALVGAFKSFPLTLAGALGMGLLEIESGAQLSSRFSALRGIERSVPLLVLMVVLVVQGKSIPARGTVAEKRPALGTGIVRWRPIAVAFAVVMALLWSPWHANLHVLRLPFNLDWVNALIVQAGIGLIVLSVVIIVGYTGQISLGQFAFAGLGALFAGRLVATQGWPFPLAAAAGVALTIPCGVLFAIPALRTRGLNLAVVTLSLAIAVNALLFERAYYSPLAKGTPKIDPTLAAILPGASSREGTYLGKPSFFGIPIDIGDHPRSYATFAILCFIGVALVVANLRRSRAGRRLIAVRTNERAASALGVDVTGAKLYAFGLSAGIAALGGIILAFQFEQVTYGSGGYNPFKSILIIAFTVIGGVGFVIGGLFGGQFWPGALATVIGKWTSAGSRHLGIWLWFGLSAVLGRKAIRAARFSGRNRTTPPETGVASTGDATPAYSSAPVRPSQRRAVGLAATAVVVLLLRHRLVDWVASIDHYVPLIGGVVLLLILLQGGGDGMAHHATHRLSTRPRSAVDVAPLDADLTSSIRERVAPATLVVSDLTVRFGAVAAVSDVSFVVRPSEILGLIGPNGAGKTTIIDAISGYNKPANGTVSLNDRAIDSLAAFKRARAGISRSFQNLELFEDLTVLDNIRAASDDRDLKAYLLNLIAPRNPALSATAVAAIKEFDLTADLSRKVSELPYGRRRLVAIARAVATSPSVLLLDEPAAGLDENESRELANLVRRLRDEWGLTILLIEHDMSFVMGTCDRIVALDFGRKIADGTPDEVRKDRRVIDAYLGANDITTEPAPGENELTGAVQS